MYPELITRPDLKVFLPPIGGISVYIFGNPAYISGNQSHSRIKHNLKSHKLIIYQILQKSLHSESMMNVMVQMSSEVTSALAAPILSMAWKNA
jgi:hypothetical protein